MNKEPNAYRAIFDDVLNFYNSDVELIPDLTGEYFMSLGSARNNCNYLPDQKYLHFFPDLNTASSYAQDLADETGKNVSVVAFNFDEKLLEECTFTGVYSVPGSLRKVEKKEYIIPLEYFDAKKNMIGTVENVKKAMYDPDDYGNGWFM